MLTNTVIANELGYGTIAAAFRRSESYTKKDDKVIEYLVDVIEPARKAFADRRYGELLTILGRTRPLLRCTRDKLIWHDFFTTLADRSEHETLGEVIDLLLNQHLFSVPAIVEERQRSLHTAILEEATTGELKLDSTLTQYAKLREAPYLEVQSLKKYIDDLTIFSTKHGVKGAEFDNVVVVFGKGWNLYNFGEMLSMHAERDSLKDKALARYERSRNLFYVATSRAKHHLALLFTEHLDDTAMEALMEIAGPHNVFSIVFDDDTSPRTVR
jgi:DNA helicase-2/ATP-dependent DNA helicase PcrA